MPRVQMTIGGQKYRATLPDGLTKEQMRIKMREKVRLKTTDQPSQYGGLAIGQSQPDIVETPIQAADITPSGITPVAPERPPTPGELARRERQNKALISGLKDTILKEKLGQSISKDYLDQGMGFANIGLPDGPTLLPLSKEKIEEEKQKLSRRIQEKQELEKEFPGMYTAGSIVGSAVDPLSWLLFSGAGAVGATGKIAKDAVKHAGSFFVAGATDSGLFSLETDPDIGAGDLSKSMVIGGTLSGLFGGLFGLASGVAKKSKTNVPIDEFISKRTGKMKELRPGVYQSELTPVRIVRDSKELKPKQIESLKGKKVKPTGKERIGAYSSVGEEPFTQRPVSEMVTKKVPVGGGEQYRRLKRQIVVETPHTGKYMDRGPYKSTIDASVDEFVKGREAGGSRVVNIAHKPQAYVSDTFDQFGARPLKSSKVRYYTEKEFKQYFKRVEEKVTRMVDESNYPKTFKAFADPEKGLYSTNFATQLEVGALPRMSNNIVKAADPLMEGGEFVAMSRNHLKNNLRFDLNRIYKLTSKEIGDMGLDIAARELSNRSYLLSSMGHYITRYDKGLEVLGKLDKELTRGKFYHVLHMMENPDYIKTMASQLPYEQVAGISKAADKFTNILKEVGLFGKKVGMEIRTATGDSLAFKLLEKYVPHRFKDPDQVVEILQSLRKIGERGGDGAMEKYLYRVGIPTEKVKKITKLVKGLARTPLSPGEYQRTIKLSLNELQKLGVDVKLGSDLIPEYLNGFFKSAFRRMFYGADYEYLLGNLDMIAHKFGSDSKAYKIAKRLVEDITGTVITGRKAIRAPRTRSTQLYETIRSLNLFRLSPSATAIQGGQVATIASQELSVVPKLFSKEVDDLGKLVGTTIRGHVDTYEKFARISRKADNIITRYAGKYLKAIGINWADLKARATAAFVGKKLALKHFEKLLKNPNHTGARLFFKDFGLGVDINRALRRGKLTQFELFNTARMYDKEFNFWMLASDLPRFMRGEIGRTLFQFKGPALLQTVAVQRLLVRSIKSGSVAGAWQAVKYALALQLSGELHGDVGDLVAGRNPFKDTPFRPGTGKSFERVVDNFFRGPGLGITSDFIQARSFSQGPVDFAISFLGGTPYATIKDIQRVVSAADKAMETPLSSGYKRIKVEKRRKRKLIRELLKVPPVPATLSKPLREWLLTDEERRNFEKRERRKKKQQRKRDLISGMPGTGDGDEGGGMESIPVTLPKNRITSNSRLV